LRFEDRGGDKLRDFGALTHAIRLDGANSQCTGLAGVMVSGPRHDTVSETRRRKLEVGDNLTQREGGLISFSSFRVVGPGAADARGSGNVMQTGPKDLTASTYLESWS
jgi:hypothetical protein